MAGRTHLFVAIVRSAFGEVVQGRRLAEALVAAGDRVVFVAPAEVQPALEGAPVRRGVLERLGATVLGDLLPQIVEAERCASMCLVDLAAVTFALGVHGVPITALARVPAPVVALDLWSLAETDRTFDYGALCQTLPDEVLAIPRLVPAPLARPSAVGAYAAWPRHRPLDPGERAAARARFGLATDERVVVTASAAWQEPERALDDAMRASARALPPLVVARVARTGATLVHVGPSPWAPPSAHYRHLSPLPPDAFAALIGCADTLLTANLSATSISTALAAEVPVVAIVSDGRALPPFRVWPLGLSRLLAPVVADNPMLDVVRIIDIAEDDALAAALAADAGWPSRARAYRAAVDALPSPATRYAEALTTAAS